VPTGVKVTPSGGADAVAGVVASWTVGFTSSSNGVLTGTSTITVVFPFSVPLSPSISVVSGFAGNCTSISGAGAGDTVTITLNGTCTLLGSTVAQLKIGGLTNPTAQTFVAGTFTVATSSDTSTASPLAGVTITASRTSSVTFSPSSPVAGNGTTSWTIGFTSSSNGTLLTTASTITVTFSSNVTVPVGTVIVTPVSGFSGGCPSIAGVGSNVTHTVIITLNASCSQTLQSTPMVFTLGGFTNPSAQTFPPNSFTLVTSVDTAAVSPSLPVTFTLGAGSLTNVTFVPTTTAAAVADSWDIGFTPSTGGALTNLSTITVVFSSGVTVPASPSFKKVAGFSGACGGIAPSGSGQTVTITLSGTCSLADSTAAVFALGGFTNPSAQTLSLTGFTLVTSGDSLTATSPTTPSGGIIITSAFPIIPVKSYPGSLTHPAEVLTIANADGAFGVVDDGNQLWVTNINSDTVYSYNDVTGALVNVITAASVNGTIVATGIDEPNTIVINGNHLFVGNNNDNYVVEFSLAGSPYSGNETATFVKDIELGTVAGDVVGRLADDGSYVWATLEQANEVFKIDASTGLVVGSAITGIDYPVGITSDGANVWVASYGSSAGDNTVTEINAATAVIENTITVGMGPYNIFTDGTDVWVADRGDSTSPGDTISVIDAATGLVTNTITVGSQPCAVVSDGTDLWVANCGDGTVSEILISTQAVINTFTLPGSGIYSIAATGSHVWVSEEGSNSLVEIGPLVNTVSFNSEGGTAESSETQASYGASIVLPTPTLAGSTFLGWYTSAVGGLLAGAGGASFTPPSTLTLYAQWSYTVTFNSNFPYVAGGAGSMSNESDSTATNLTANAFSDTGYTFTGWNTIAAGGGTAYAGGASYPFTASVTLYAQWSANALTVIFNANTAAGAMGNESFTSGVAKALSANGYTVPAGATFGGWNTAANGTGTGYGAGASITIYASVTLFAQWNYTLTLNFNSEGGSAVSPESGQSGESFTLPGAPTYASNTFNGWFTAPTGGTLVASPYTLTANTTLYAQWSVSTDTVTFNANTGVGSMNNETENVGVATTLTANSFTKTGYAFTGWNTIAAGGGSAYADGASYPFTASVILYAQWSANAVTVTFNASTGVGSMSNETESFGVATTLTANTFTKTGYTFTGWNTMAAGGGSFYADAASYPYTASVTLYAQWSPIVYVVVYNAEGGIVLPTSADFTTGDPALRLPSPSYAGYTFDGWYTAQYGGTFVGDAAGSYTPSGPVPSIALYADWLPFTYSVTYNPDGGAVGTPSVTYVVGTPALALPTPTLPGSTFAGWYTAPSGGTYLGAAGAPFTPTSTPVTLYAQWIASPPTDTINFGPNGGTGSINALTGKNGSSAVLPSDTGFNAPPGYSAFAGWSTSSGHGNSVNYNVNSSYALAGAVGITGSSVTLYAVWLPSSSGGAPVFTSSYQPVFAYGHETPQTVTAVGSPAISLSATFNGGTSLPAGVSFTDNGGGNATLTLNPLTTLPGTYVLVFTAINAEGSNTQIYTFSVTSPYAPTSVVATTDLSKANSVKVTWVAPADGVVTSYTVVPTNVSPGGGVGAAIIDIAPSTSCAGISGLCLEVTNLVGGDTYNFVVTAVFNSGGTESSATSNYTLPTVVAPSGATGSNAAGSVSFSQSGSSSASIGASGATGSITATGIGQGIVSVGVYANNPAAGVFSVAAGTDSYDVSLSAGSKFMSVSFELCGVGTDGQIEWFDSLNDTSYLVQPAPVAVSGSPSCYTVNLNATSVPTTNDATLYGSIFYVAIPKISVSDPTPPLDVTAKAGDASATVTWTVPASDGGAPITSYVVTSAPGGYTCTVSDPSVLTCIVNGLTNGTTYTFAVAAINAHSASTPGGPSNPVVPEGPAVKKPREVIVILDPFVTGSSVLLPRMDVQLTNLAKTIKRYGGKSVVITGFTDSRNGYAYNLALGLARATSANVYLRAQLQRLGVKINFSIRVITKGLTSPAASNTTPAGEAKNRRVVLVAMLY